ncbi:hypothetical protein [Corynebacterium alimapuense]|uniref:TadE-like protein n=1 Tax=Corynebacterium alimapuense TaxID=1576874 RepID=A0A3M8K779_9CORY|nr:hypothetical protein [Corynebacterium alimapuense]RNE49006.1 hypothetical protein C5L39_06905 [Corynebacterium alimapuense]
MLSNDRGSVSVEAALALLSLVVVCGLVIGAIQTMAVHLVAVDAAGAAARAYAIGVDYVPPLGKVDIAESAGLVTVTASIPAVYGTMSHTAVFPMEQP